MEFQDKYKVKSINKYISQHWIDWFPNLHSYETFVNRLNRISVLFPLLVSELIKDLDIDIDESTFPIVLTDSMPIIACSNKRKPKVVLDLIDKGHCSTKNLHYNGVKFQLVAKSRSIATIT